MPFAVFIALLSFINFVPTQVLRSEQIVTEINGVLGGFGKVHKTDSIMQMLRTEKFKDWIPGFQNAIDCGAGIGRITKETLIALKTC